jgi:hypothetical protein
MSVWDEAELAEVRYHLGVMARGCGGVTLPVMPPVSRIRSGKSPSH